MLVRILLLSRYDLPNTLSSRNLQHLDLKICSHRLHFLSCRYAVSIPCVTHCNFRSLLSAWILLSLWYHLSESVPMPRWKVLGRHHNYFSRSMHNMSCRLCLLRWNKFAHKRNVEMRSWILLCCRLNNHNGSLMCSWILFKLSWRNVICSL